MQWLPLQPHTASAKWDSYVVFVLQTYTVSSLYKTALDEQDLQYNESIIYNPDLSLKGFVLR